MPRTCLMGTRGACRLYWDFLDGMEEVKHGKTRKYINLEYKRYRGNGGVYWIAVLKKCYIELWLLNPSCTGALSSLHSLFPHVGSLCFTGFISLTLPGWLPFHWVLSTSLCTAALPSGAFYLPLPNLVFSCVHIDTLSFFIVQTDKYMCMGSQCSEYSV